MGQVNGIAVVYPVGHQQSPVHQGIQHLGNGLLGLGGVALVHQGLAALAAAGVGALRANAHQLQAQAAAPVAL